MAGRKPAPDQPPRVRQKDPQEQKPHADPWMPPPSEEADIGALKAVAAGQASPEQQKRALNYIVYVACGTYDLAYRPRGDRDTCFALGRQFVGQHLVTLVNLDLSKQQRST